jgi:hypothetical protein
MSNLIKYLSLFALISFSLNSYAEKKWYAGGGLHSSSVQEWRKSTYENKLATAADWTLASPSVKKTVQDSGDINTNKFFAKELVTCIDKAIEGVDISGGATDIAVSCMVIMGWLK